MNPTRETAAISNAGPARNEQSRQAGPPPQYFYNLPWLHRSSNLSVNRLRSGPHYEPANAPWPH